MAKGGGNSKAVVAMSDVSITVPSIFGPQGAQGAIMPGITGFSTTELRVEPPRLKIVHALRRKGGIGMPGEYVLGSQAYESLDVVFLKVHPGRALREGEGSNAHLICASPDRKRPHPSIESPQDVSCVTCEYSAWTDGTDGKRVPPPCAEFIAFLGVVPAEDHRPFWFICQKTARKPAMEFIQAVNSLLLEGVPHLGCLLTHLRTEEQVSGGGPDSVVWYTPVFTITERLPRERYDAMAKAVQETPGLEYCPRIFGVTTDDDGAETPHKVDSVEKAVSPPMDDDIPF